MSAPQQVDFEIGYRASARLLRPWVNARHCASLEERMALMPGWTEDIVIDCSQELAWNHLTDFARYKEWNPFVLDARAEFKVGSTIYFLEDLEYFGKYWLSAEFLSIDPLHSFRWEGHWGAPHLFRVRHTFELKQIGNGLIRFTQTHENFGAFIPYLAWMGVYVVSNQGYRGFNQAFKSLCEAASISLDRVPAIQRSAADFGNSLKEGRQLVRERMVE